MDGFTSFHSSDKSPEPNDLINHLTVMNVETFTELLNPSLTDQYFSQFGYSTQPNFQAQMRDMALRTSNASNDMDGDHSGIGDNSPAEKTILQSQAMVDPCQMNIVGKITSSSSFPPCDVSDDDDNNKGIPSQSFGASLAERLLKALSLFKESSGGGILAQVWMPLKHGEEYALSTSEQPYLFDQVLAGYREASRVYTFSAREAPGAILGLPGRVFVSEKPEWTSNIVYYSRLEYLRVDQALKYEVRGSLALPIFDAKEHSCCAVLELVTKKEKPDFDLETNILYNALQTVNLKTVKGHGTRHILSLQVNQRSAFTEILNVLTAVCHAHMLPLALTWVPFNDFDQGRGVTCSGNKEINSVTKMETMLRIQESACYVNDQQMLGFLRVCSENYLRKGQGVAGKAIQSNRPFFHPDIKEFDVQQYPLVHHARKFRLHAAVALRLRSTYTGNDDYTLEFFLPVNCRGSIEQQHLLNNLSITLQRICRSLRIASDAEATCLDDTRIHIDISSGVDFSSVDLSKKLKQSSIKPIFDTQSLESDSQEEAAHLDQLNFASRKHLKRSNSTLEKDISLSVLQKYYSGTLKDAAKSIGVCPTTLKRICRQNGILRWPSRKIKKVNHSVQKIQSVIDSVPGVVGKLKYNPSTGSLITEVSSTEKDVFSSESSDKGMLPIRSTQGIESKQFVGTSETNDCLVGGGSQQIESSDRHLLLNGEKGEAHISPLDGCDKFKLPSVGGVTNLAKEICQQETCGKGDVHSLNLRCHIASRSSSSKLVIEEMHKEGGTSAQNTKNNRTSECRYPSCSNRTDSSSGSASSDQTIKKSVETSMLPVEASKLPDNMDSTITVKASYKEDIVRFKFHPSMGCFQLVEEIGKRFNLSVGTFQLKYKDDEDEWIMLVNDSDLQECIELLESCGSQCVRLRVGDLLSAVGSSGSSNSLFLRP